VFLLIGVICESLQVSSLPNEETKVHQQTKKKEMDGGITS
jgi:hypothetical protein